MPRDPLIDALRGFALFGILAVNIQGYVTGLSAPSLGILSSQSTRADHHTVLLTAFLFEFKFYPIFSFCFGYGFAVQTRRWIAGGEPVGTRFLRRMNAMLFMGILHGALLWFGDILTRYALAGYILRRYAGRGPRQLLDAAKSWFIVALGFMLVMAAIVAASSWAGVSGELIARRQELRTEVAHALAAYAHGSYIEATLQRVNDFAVVTAGFIMLVPHFMVIFLLGAIAAQLGLLRKPDKHHYFWEKMLRLGLWAGIPINIVYAWLQWQASQHPWAPTYSATSMVTGELAPIMSLAFIAAFALYGSQGAGRKLVLLLAPAGRIALTLYVCQSVLMAVLLSGFGLGLGATMGPAGQLGIAIAIYALLIAASHVMQRYAIRGPLETFWRRYTYAPIAQTVPHPPVNR